MRRGRGESTVLISAPCRQSHEQKRKNTNDQRALFAELPDLWQFYSCSSMSGQSMAQVYWTLSKAINDHYVPRPPRHLQSALRALS